MVSPFLISIYLGAIYTTYFGISSAIEGYFFIIASSINGLFLPIISTITIEENFKFKLNKLMQQIGKYQFSLLGILFVFFLLYGRTFILLWLDDDYTQVYPLVILLLIPSLFSQTQYIGATILLVLNRVKENTIGMLISGFLSTLLSIIFGLRMIILLYIFFHWKGIL
jgi:O-antigen/teichoic acid export membrane protein